MFPFASKLPFPSNLQNKEKYSNNAHPEKCGKPRIGISLTVEEHPSTALHMGGDMYTVVAWNRNPHKHIHTYPFSRLTKKYKKERNKYDCARSNLCSKQMKKALGNQFL